LEQAQITLWASVLNKARLEGQSIAQLSKTLQFSRPDAYEMQETQLRARVVAGEKQVGWKMGLTSEAKRRQMNLDSPLYGFLTASMQVENRGQYSLLGKIHPKIEPEVAFLIERDLSGPNVTREQALAACGAVCAALEILDSRYDHFKYFSMEDVIADNSSSSEFILGPWLRKFRDLDLLNLKMEMSADGEVVESGLSSDISGDPVQSVVELCALLAERGQTLKAGSIVLAGAATTAIALKPNLKVELKVDGLEPVSVGVSS
jgi:2-oxo-3-hexenedioate decarboxylase